MPKTALAQLCDALYGGRHPFADAPPGLYRADPQGWHSDHPYLADSVRRLRPRFVMEVGVWKGGSTMTMARALREHEVDGVVIAVDTWLGSVEHWVDPEMRRDLNLTHGYPQLFRTFMQNVIEGELQDFVVPFPMDAVNAYELMRHLGVRPSLIHVDAGHDYASVWSDLTQCWGLLAEGGEMICDDYDINGDSWPEVCRAVDEFRADRPDLAGFESADQKCRLTKAS